MSRTHTSSTIGSNSPHRRRTDEAIEAWTAAHGETLGHRPREVYVSDPASTPEAEIQTWVMFPLSTDDGE